MQRCAKSIVLGICITACAVLIGLWKIPWVTTIERRMPAIEWQPDGSSYSDPFAVQISGKYYHYLWRDDVFVGTVAIEGYTLNPFPNRIIIGNKPRYTEWNETIRIEIGPEGSGFAPLTMTEVGRSRDREAPGCYRKDNRLVISFGITPGFTCLQAVVLAPVDDNTYGTACYLSAPATTPEDAQRINAAIYGTAE